MQLQEKLWEIFKEIDITGDLQIQWDELKICCEKINVEVEDSDKTVFQHIKDKKHEDGIDFDGFQEFIKTRLEKIFDEIDTDKSGYITFEEIHAALQKLNIKICERKIKAIIKTMDLNNDNVIDFNEFCSFFADLPSPSLQGIAKKWSYGEGLDFGSDIAPSTVPPVEMPLLQFVLAGGIAGVASRTFTAPLEKIKILAQTSSHKIGIIDGLKNAGKLEGIKGLFSGNLTNCLRIFPTSAIVCLVYSRMIKYTPVDNTNNPHQPLWRFVSGATAGIIATSFTHPLDVIRARLTVQPKGLYYSPTYTGIFNALKTIHIEEGIRGLYKGLVPSLISVGPFLGVQQCVYDILKTHALNSQFSATPATFVICGAFAGMAAQTTIHPLDVVRRQMQVTRSTDNIAQSSILAIKHLYKSGGMARLYAGLTASYAKVIPAASISLLVRDAVLGRLDNT